MLIAGLLQALSIFLSFYLVSSSRSCIEHIRPLDVPFHFRRQDSSRGHLNRRRNSFELVPHGLERGARNMNWRVLHRPDGTAGVRCHDGAPLIYKLDDRP